MPNPLKWIFILLAAVVCACARKPPAVEGFDSVRWKNDHHGCQGIRPQIVDSLLSHREVVLGEDEQAVMTILGRPDQTELYTRNQKFYYYFVDPSPDCSVDRADASRRLQVRFNAVGLTTEVNLIE